MKDELNALMAARREKLKLLEEMNVNPFANDFKPEHTTELIHERFDDKSAEELEGNEERFSLAGRIMAVRSFGKAAFLVLQDRNGRLQIFVQKNKVGEEAFKLFKMMDVGDIIGTSGTPFRTKTDELTLFADSVRLLTKNLRPLPEKFHGLTDTETRYRQRYVDLTVNPEVVKIFRMRSEIVKFIRRFLEARDFMEVETPMLQPMAGGAVAKPFVTHHNALDMEMYLRIAPELYLKRLLVGGLERVFEINRNFRNEGISTRHNPEFTMLEFYWAYATYEDLMTLTETLLSGLADALHGSFVVPGEDGDIDFTPPFERLTPKEAILKYSDLTEDDLANREAMLAAAKKVGVDKDPNQMGDGKLLMEIFEFAAEEKLINPTFLLAFPTEVSPLARRNEENPEITDRFELYIGGKEIANAFSELNDPIDQKGRFERQLEEKAKGDDEAHGMDNDYIRALEYGMPPAAGEGIGIDRLVMIMTGMSSIREVILFPVLRKEQP